MQILPLPGTSILNLLAAILSIINIRTYTNDDIIPETESAKCNRSQGEKRATDFPGANVGWADAGGKRPGEYMPLAIKPQTLDIWWLLSYLVSFWSKGVRMKECAQIAWRWILPIWQLPQIRPCVVATSHVMFSKGWTELRFLSDLWCCFCLMLCEKKLSNG